MMIVCFHEHVWILIKNKIGKQRLFLEALRLYDSILYYLYMATFVRLVYTVAVSVDICEMGDGRDSCVC